MIKPVTENTNEFISKYNIYVKLIQLIKYDEVIGWQNHDVTKKYLLSKFVLLLILKIMLIPKKK